MTMADSRMLSDTITGRPFVRRQRARQMTEILTVLAAFAMFFGLGWMVLMAMA